MQEMTHKHTRELDVFYNEHRDACTNCGRRFQNGMCAHLGYDAERNPVVLCNNSKVITNRLKKMPPCSGCPARNARRKIRVFHRRMKSSRLPCQSYSAAPGLRSPATPP